MSRLSTSFLKGLSVLICILVWAQACREPDVNPSSGDNCSNTCEFAFDGECDDGGAGSLYDFCPCNTDCADCGSRRNGCGSSGSGSGGNSGTSNNGNVTFWVARDFGCGNISVTLDGSRKTISSYYSGSNPGCNSSGNANFTEGAGTYSYTASCTEYNWSGSVTITNGGCKTIQLTL